MKCKRLEIENFLELLKGKDKVLFIFDYDGTLTPIVNNPSDALTTPEQKAAINELHALDSARVALVSGRGLTDLKSLLNDGLDSDIDLLGTHGAEINDEASSSPYQTQLDEIRTKYQNEAGVEVENKTLAVTFHYKNHANPEDFISRLQAEAENYSEIFRVQQGHQVFEFLPKAFNKGAGVKFLNERYPNYFPIFMGDDLTDNFAFKAVNELGGLSIQVKDNLAEQEAEYLIDDVKNVYELIKAYNGHNSKIA